MQCLGWLVLSGCYANGILQCVSRGNTRKKYRIEGNKFSDLLASCCCMCCALVQEAKEVKENQLAAPAGYQKAPTMVYSSGL